MNDLMTDQVSLPTRERGLKQATLTGAQGGLQSLPTRERGLKRADRAGSGVVVPSLPTRERGLKLAVGVDLAVGRRVAPYAGAWIETSVR